MASNLPQLKSDLLAILGAAATDLGVTLTEAAPRYIEQLARLSAAYAAAKAAGQTTIAEELFSALDAQSKDVASIVADEMTTTLQRAWTAIVQVLVKTVVIAIKAA